MRAITIHFAALALAWWALGCTCSPSGATCPAGEEGCACAAGERCLTGLECRDGRCVDPGGTSMDGGGTTHVDSGPRDAGPPPVEPNPEAFWEDDPPPRECYPDGGMGPLPDPPGGTPECPDDRNREGCRCPTVGETAPCWPGRRVNRNRGICRDGTTTCVPYDEFTGVWGPCTGYVAPVEGETRGAGACRCFSAGRWQIDNLSPCFVDYGTSGVYAVSTYIGSDGAARCPDLPAGATPPPAPQPATDWSTDRLTVDCEGRFELCYTLRAGDAAAPSASDCVVARACTGEIWYPERDVVMELPPLPSWTSSDSACARQFRDSGGYGEMSVLGLSIECDPVDDGSGGEYVFNRVNYCPIRCNTDPTLPECMGCMMGGSGMF